MADLRVLIAAAGAGRRAGLPYPKTLHPVLGRPILLRLLDLFGPFDPCPAVIVSPAGREPVASALAEAGLRAQLIVQQAPTGMGDAVLLARELPDLPTHLLVVWGDIPFLEHSTVAALLEAHRAHASDFTFATRRVERAYTIVERDAVGRVIALTETREVGSEPGAGERDIGLFAFRAAPVLDVLARRLPGAIGQRTGEHGFLYVVGHLVRYGFRVEAAPVASERDLVSLNSLADLAGVEPHKGADRGD